MRGRLAMVAALGLTLVAAKSDPFAGRVAGPPVQCVDTSTAQSGPSIVDNGTIIINAGGRRIWRAQVRGECPSLRPFNTLLIQQWGSRLCRNDRFQVLQQGLSIPSASCFFDGFVPYDRVKK